MMNRLRGMACLGAIALATAVVSAQVSTSAPGTPSWVGKAAEFEEFLRTAPVVKAAPLSIGVTKSQRVFFAPGGPVDSAAWKILRPGMRQGYFESYKSEIAAYELDKLLELGMVPPKVERKVDGDVGVAIMWVAPATSFKESGGMPKAPSIHQARFNGQLTRAKMFHNLIGDIDPNLGQLARRSRLEPDSDRSFPGVDQDQEPRAQDAGEGRRPVDADDGLDGRVAHRVGRTMAGPGRDSRPARPPGEDAGGVREAGPLEMISIAG